jgi:hypothetical protein
MNEASYSSSSSWRSCRLTQAQPLLLTVAAEEDAMRKNVTWTNKSNQRLQLFVVRTGLRVGRAARGIRKAR